MVRMEVQLTERQSMELRRMAKAQGVSVAALIRQAVDVVLATEPDDEDATARALSVIGCIHDAPDLAERPERSV